MTRVEISLQAATARRAQHRRLFFLAKLEFYQTWLPQPKRNLRITCTPRCSACRRQSSTQLWTICSHQRLIITVAWIIHICTSKSTSTYTNQIDSHDPKTAKLTGKSSTSCSRVAHGIAMISWRAYFRNVSSPLAFFVTSVISGSDTTQILMWRNDYCIGVIQLKIFDLPYRIRHGPPHSCRRLNDN